MLMMILWQALWLVDETHLRAAVPCCSKIQKILLRILRYYSELFEFYDQYNLLWVFTALPAHLLYILLMVSRFSI